MEKDHDKFVNIETLNKIEELQNMMREINSETYDKILEISLNMLTKSNELIFSYFNSLKSMLKSRKKSTELYLSLGSSIIESCSFLSKEILETDALNIHSETIKKVEIKTNSEKSHQTIEKLDQIIKLDDIEQFQSILSHTNLNPNSEICIITSKSDTSKSNPCETNKESSYSLIEYAALNSSINIFKFLLLNLQGKPNLNENLYNNAIKGGNYDIIHLIEKEYPQVIKQSSLYKAISSHQNQIAHYLLDNFDFIQFNNKCAIKSVKAFNVEFILKYLNMIKDKETKELLNPLFVEAIKTRQLFLVKFILLNYSKFIDLNQHFYSKQTKRLLTPLIFSIKMKFNEISLFLIHQKKIIIQYSDDEYEPDALNVSIKTKNHQIIKELLKLPSIQINNLDFNYYAPIHYSIFVKDFISFSMIIQMKNADILLRGGNNETIFHYAALNSFIEIFDFALNNHQDKFDLNAKNIYGILCNYFK